MAAHHLLKNEVENIKNGFFQSPIGTCKNSFLSACDQGEAAAICLLEGPEKHANKFYVVTGPEPQSMHQVAADLSEVLGHKVEYREQCIEQFEKDSGPTLHLRPECRGARPRSDAPGAFAQPE